ncbi:MAG: hypothetical protein L0196_07590 [candidate division Zixibacteria bacterium]|nr:hypothetical protein [candidate division Zixibacteria bacterium]
MSQTLNYLKSKRIWAVPGVAVYGTLGAAELLLLRSEVTASTKRIIFETAVLGGVEQVLFYANLTDFRGNKLPQKLKNPKVVVLPKSAIGAIVVGGESDELFRLAKTAGADNAFVDLLIVEMG